MLGFDITNVRRVTLSSIGALLLSGACVVAAVGPAQAATVESAPLTPADWQMTVETQIDRTLVAPRGALRSRERAVALVRMAFAADGSFSGAQLLRSSGTKSVDEEALRVASAIDYPLLPPSLCGKPQAVVMQIYVGRGTSVPRSADQRRHAREALAKAPRGSHEGPDRRVAEWLKRSV